MADALLAGDKWAEAAALFGREGKRIKDAQDKLGVSGTNGRFFCSYVFIDSQNGWNSGLFG